MTTQSSKFEKMMRIFTILSQYNWTSAETLAMELDVSKRTVFRYINEINIPFQDNGITLIESSPDGYRLKDTNFLDKLKSIDDQYTIAAISTSTFAKNLNTKTKINKTLYEKLNSRLYKSADISEKILEKLLKAFLENRIIEIEYIRKTGELKTYKVLPLRLVLNSGVHYLQTYALHSKIIQHFSVSKIKKVYIKEGFNDKELITEQLKYIDSRWGTFANDAKNYTADVEFIVDESLYGTLKESPLHSSQEYKYIKGKHHFFLKVHNTLEFDRWTMKYGNRITVISPQSLIDTIIKESNELIKRYEK